MILAEQCRDKGISVPLGHGEPAPRSGYREDLRMDPLGCLEGHVQVLWVGRAGSMYLAGPRQCLGSRYWGPWDGAGGPEAGRSP